MLLLEADEADVVVPVEEEEVDESSGALDLRPPPPCCGTFLRCM